MLKRKVRGEFDPKWPIPALPDEVTKSCGRTLRILEYIDDVQRSVSEVELVEVLGYPQSSVAALLKSMTKLGYLSWSAETHLYMSTSRVLLLGHWLQPDLMEEGHILTCVRRVAEQTGHSTILATRQALSALYIHVAKMGRTTLTTGTVLPLLRSSTGIALISTYSDQTIRTLVRRVNAESTEPTDRVSEDVLLNKIRLVQSRGYAFENGPVTPNFAVISMPLPVTEGNVPLSISLGGPIVEMEERKSCLVALMRSEIEKIRT